MFPTPAAELPALSGEGLQGNHRSVVVRRGRGIEHRPLARDRDGQIEFLAEAGSDRLVAIHEDGPGAIAVLHQFPGVRAAPAGERPAGIGDWPQRDHLAVGVGLGRGQLYLALPQGSHLDAVLGLGEDGRQRLVTIHKERPGTIAVVLRIARVWAGPAIKDPCCIGDRLQERCIAIGVGVAGRMDHLSAARDGDGHREGIGRRERGRQRLVAIHDQGVGAIAILGQLPGMGTAPTGKDPARDGHGR